MKIILASGNKGKIKEFHELLPNATVTPYKEILGDFEIDETGLTFQENAIIKAQEIYTKLNDPEAVVISDDSGISVPALNGEPGIYSARYAGIGVSDKDNLYKLIDNLKKNNITKTAAFYTACIAIVYKNTSYTVHGWMHGDVIDTTKGEGGFGYDPMFIPTGYTQTLGELSSAVKKEFSHRTKALNLALKILKYCD
ncbi:MAG: RdgB/HAM1 family non-canonical purine NTP pyrophosphatase [Campylobacterota bacterium]|nr:RdgB/HAM1 family non-canonical purine NTP pyrophosphatase [Campylobacterota bacterium]